MRAARCLLKDFRIAVNVGDGIGADIVPAALRLLSLVEQCTPHRFEPIPVEAGFNTLMRLGQALPPETLDTCETCDAALFGPVFGPTRSIPGYFAPYVLLKRKLDLYAQLTRCTSLPIVASGFKAGVDVLIVRENLEGFYIQQETLEETAHGRSAIALRRVTEQNSTLVARCAFEQAQRRRKLLTVVHKSNILTVSDGLFRESCFSVAREFPDVTVEEQITEAFICSMIRDPSPYDVIVTPNMFGDFLSEALAALVGGLQYHSQCNVGGRFILVHPIHGTADDIACHTANPASMLRSVGLLLEHLVPEGRELAQRIDRALFGILQDRIVVPYDMGGSSDTVQITDAFLERFEKLV